LDFLNDVLRETLGNNSAIDSFHPVTGGNINRVFRLNLECGARVLVKLSGDVKAGYGSEAEGLSAIRDTQTVATPNIIALGEEPEPYLILEWIETAAPQAGFWQNFGQQLAALHGAMPPTQKFGFASDNVIGATPQINTWAETWVEFFCDRRLRFQFELACRGGHFSGRDSNDFDIFLENVKAVLQPIDVSPALIHGDLWSGNFLCDENQKPVLIDPAVSYSHCESEFSIIKMFGGFDRKFFDAYDEVRPPQTGREQRVELYSLYHYLNHLNLFGRSYLSDCRPIIDKYL